MHLKSLTLKGFKSFAQPTTFQFEPGVTCVVGPNGSGKSNVVDALAWVMGEQGAKTLRGGTMSDVIFAGTATRGPLGRAEVLLTIDNSDGMLPIEYAEVTISRTLFRNGGSEYAINGTACRLLDVQELLSDSGLGREMHVIVGQGQLDAVLHASPEERRGFIEEAAGILKHRRRKEKTVRKLEGMQANLTRLNDLAGEIRRQLTPLGRQAEIAREAQTIAAIVRDARARLLADEVVALRESLADHQRTESERSSERLVLQSQLDQARVRVQRLEAEQVGDAVDGARRLAFELEQVQERLRSLYSLAQQKLTLLSQQSELPGLSSTITQAQVAEARAEAESLGAEVEAAERTVGEAAADTAVADTTARIDGERDALHALERERDALAARVSALSQAVDAGVGASGLIGTKGVRGLVADHLQVRSGFEAAIAAALGTLAEAALADDLDAGLRALESARGSDAGRVEVVLAELSSAGSGVSDLPAGTGLTPAADVVTAPAGVLDLLARTLIADDLDAARTAWAALEKRGDGAATVSIVTRQGEVLTRSVLRGGSGEGRSRLELAAERDAARDRLSDVTTGIERARYTLDESRSALTEAKGAATAALAAVRDQDAQRAARSEQVSRARAQAEAAEAEAARLTTALERAQESVAEAERAVERSEAEHADFAGRPRPMLDASARDQLLSDL